MLACVCVCVCVCVWWNACANARQQKGNDTSKDFRGKLQIYRSMQNQFTLSDGREALGTAQFRDAGTLKHFEKNTCFLTYS